MTFLSATDPRTADEFSTLRSSYDDASQSHREGWFEESYETARGSFEERFGVTPEAFTDAFEDSSADTKEVLRRMIGSGDFSDAPEPKLAAEMLGHDHQFPGFIDFIADRHSWSPPLPEP